MISAKENTFEYRLDFLYQSIAIYAGTLVLYLLVRSQFLDKQFPIIWEDPILALLSIIIVLSLGGLIYNLIMRRRIVVHANEVHFSSAARERVVKIEDVISVHFAREKSRKIGRGMRVVRIRLAGRRRPIRIHPYKFSNAKGLVESLKVWSGSLGAERSRMKNRATLGRKLGRSTGDR